MVNVGRKESIRFEELVELSRTIQKSRPDKTHFHMAHRCQVIDLIRLYFLNDSYQISAVCQITIMQFEIDIFFMRIKIEVIDPLSIEERTASFNTMNHVAFV